MESLTLNVDEVAAMVGVSSRSIWRLLKAGFFPEPIRLGARTLWRRRDVELFLEAGATMPAYRRARRGE